MNSDTKAIIAGSVRTLAQLVPIAGGAVAQAWSEYESHAQNKRTEEYFDQIAQDLRELQSRYADLQKHIASMPDAAELLERTVAAARKETSDAKRRMFSRLYTHYLAKPSETSPDERLDIIYHVEQLSQADITLLRVFTNHGGVMRGDMVTGTVNPGYSVIGQKESDTDWLQRHGPVVHSISKLEARGLLLRTRFNASFSYAGDSGSPFNRFREQAWRITPIGIKLLQALA
jgi:hypothetical protein